jgi:hypothetical protein
VHTKCLVQTWTSPPHIRCNAAYLQVCIRPRWHSSQVVASQLQRHLDEMHTFPMSAPHLNSLAAADQPNNLRRAYSKPHRSRDYKSTQPLALTMPTFYRPHSTLPTPSPIDGHVSIASSRIHALTAPCFMTCQPACCGR